MKKIKNNIKVVIAFILGIIIPTSVIYASVASNVVTYNNTNSGSSATTVKDAIDDLYNIANKKKYLGKIKVGDYVKMTPTLTSYTVTSADTGYTFNQTINPSELNLWRIISINSDGTADAVSEYISSEWVSFEGKKGYQNFVGTLNKIAASYTNSSYVERTRHMGYSGQTNYISNTTKLNQTTEPWTESTPSFSTTLADEQQGGGDIGYKADYNLVRNVLGKVWAYRAGTTYTENYWLASRYYDYYNMFHWSFLTMYVATYDDVTASELYHCSNPAFTEDYATASIRPIITLKAGLTTSGGDGKSASTAWTFN